MVASALGLGRRLRTRPALAAGMAVAVVGVVVVVAALVSVAGPPATETPRRQSRPNVATVDKGDLVVRETVSGTLGYGEEQPLVNRLSGTITWLPKPGTTVRRGQALYDVDGRAGAYLMYGRTPAWRTLGIDSSDGIDIRQLESNLVALGYDPNGDVKVDDDFTAATARMVKRWQKAEGLPQTGIVELGRVVFLPGPRRVASLTGSEGLPAGPGQIMTTTSTTRRVDIELDASKRSYVSVGDAVIAELPSGRTVRGKISSIGRVARETDEGAVIDVRVSLKGPIPDLDRAPVSVRIVQHAERDVLRIPVTALLAQRGGGYAVDVVRPDGRIERVAVVPGTYADGIVEVEGGKLRKGDKVVVPE